MNGQVQTQPVARERNEGGAYGADFVGKGGYLSNLMQSGLISHFALCAGTAGDGDDEYIPELLFSIGSSPDLLPCFSRSPVQIDGIHWIFAPASGNNGMRLCPMDNKRPQCSSPRFPHLSLAEIEGFRTGNYSLLFTATMEDAGN